MSANNEKLKQALTGGPGFYSSSKTNVVDDVEAKGNTDAKILAKAFEGYAADGLTTGERDLIEKLDDILKGADIVISKDGSFATIAQDDGQTFKVTPKGRGGR